MRVIEGWFVLLDDGWKVWNARGIVILLSQECVEEAVETWNSREELQISFLVLFEGGEELAVVLPTCYLQILGNNLTYV